jgi:hypothetical protein
MSPEASVPIEVVDVGVHLRRSGEPLRPRVFDTPRVQRRAMGAVEQFDLLHCQTLDLVPAGVRRLSARPPPGRGDVAQPRRDLPAGNPPPRPRRDGGRLRASAWTPP